MRWAGAYIAEAASETEGQHSVCINLVGVRDGPDGLKNILFEHSTLGSLQKEIAT